MIIKSMTNKRNKFAYIIPYILDEEKTHTPENSVTIYHNLHSFQAKDIIKEFEENDAYREKRKGRIYYYHEVMSFHPKDLKHLTPKIVEDLAQQYIELRAPNALCLCHLHQDKEHAHVHFLFSSNQYKSKDVIRQSKGDFKGVCRLLEAYQRDRYPELSHSVVQEKEPSKDKTKNVGDYEKTDSEVHVNKRHKTTHKEILSQKLADFYLTSLIPDDFFQSIIQEGINLYQRNGRNTGIIFENRKYKFQTLGIDQEHIKVLTESIAYKRMQELKELREWKEKRKAQERDVGRGRELSLEK